MNKGGELEDKSSQVLDLRMASLTSPAFLIRLHLHANSPSHIVRDEWWPVATAWADGATACGEEPMTGGRTQHGTPTRLGFLHAGKRIDRR